jgi:hypothetical protein
MSTIDSQLVYVVDRDNEAAWSVARKICESRPRSGQFVPVTAEEFEALKSGVIALALPGDLSKSFSDMTDKSRADRFGR